MTRKMTIRKLAKKLDLAPSTVHRALSGHPNVQPETRRSILRAAQSCRYLLPLHEKRNIAVIVPSFQFSGYLECLLPCLETEFRKRGFRLQLIPEPDIPLLGDHMFDGIVSLVWKEGLDKSLPKDYAIPLLTLNAPYNPRENVSRIASDPRGIRMALDYLHKQGCRKIFFISTRTENAPEAAERLEEFRKFCLDNGQDYDALHLEMHSQDIEGMFPLILNAKPDACFCASETFAVKIGSLLKAAGRRIPEDISLMGLEDDQRNAYFSPPITAIRQNFEQMAEMAAEEMFQVCQNQIITQNRTVSFTLIERESIRKPELI